MSGDTCEMLTMDGVQIQQNGIIRNSEGRLIGRLDKEVGFDSEHLKRIPQKGTSVNEAFEILKWHMENDSGYAWGWHCNIAMACYDAMPDDINQRHEIGNDAASRFMKLCFDVDTRDKGLTPESESSKIVNNARVSLREDFPEVESPKFEKMWKYLHKALGEALGKQDESACIPKPDNEPLNRESLSP